jgi:hypothetical protein
MKVVGSGILARGSPKSCDAWKANPIAADLPGPGRWVQELLFAILILLIEENEPRRT